MDISDSNRIPPLPHLIPKVLPEKEGHAPSTKENPSSSPQQSITDQLTVSHRVNQHQAIQDLLKQIPEVRQERVTQIREALESGQYQVSSDVVADRIIRDILLNQPPTEK